MKYFVLKLIMVKINFSECNIQFKRIYAMKFKMIFDIW